jgi:hypothetical protein
MQGYGHASTVRYIAVMVKEAEESALSWMTGKSEASKKIEGLKEKAPA